MSTATITNGNGRRARRSPTRTGCRTALRRSATRRPARSAHLLLVVGVAGLVLVIGAFIEPEAVLPLVPVRLRLRARHRPRRVVLGADPSRRGRRVVGRPAAGVTRTSTARLSRSTVLFVPVLIGIFSGQSAPWYGFIHGPEPADEHLKHVWHVKHLYFSTPFFLRRLALYFGGLDRLLGRDAELVDAQDAVGGAAHHQEDAVVGAVGRRAARPDLDVLRVRSC